MRNQRFQHKGIYHMQIKKNDENKYFSTYQYDLTFFMLHTIKNDEMYELENSFKLYYQILLFLL